MKIVLMIMLMLVILPTSYFIGKKILPDDKPDLAMCMGWIALGLGVLICIGLIPLLFYAVAGYILELLNQ